MRCLARTRRSAMPREFPASGEVPEVFGSDSRTEPQWLVGRDYTPARERLQSSRLHDLATNESPANKLHAQHNGSHCGHQV
jgi:hypothetical protein